MSKRSSKELHAFVMNLIRIFLCKVSLKTAKATIINKRETCKKTDVVVGN